MGIRLISRPGWDEYFLVIAKDVASRATCPRASVGAVIVKDSRILSTGYNGAPAGEPHCIEEGCIIVNNHCQRAVHAESNAIATAAKFGISVDGATLYFWDSQGRPAQSCINCSLLMQAAGIKRIVGRIWDKKVNRWD